MNGGVGADTKEIILVQFVHIWYCQKMKYFTTTNARKNIALIIDEVRENNSVVALGRRNRPDVLLLKYPEFYNRLVSDEVNFQANSKALDFLRDEPETYSVSDIKKRYG